MSCIKTQTDTLTALHTFYLEGTYEVFFSSSSNPLVQQVYELAKQEKYGCLIRILLDIFMFFASLFFSQGNSEV